MSKLKSKIKVSFAVGYNGEFGNSGSLPWGSPYKEDMVAFNNFIKDCVLVMGRKTFESLPYKLKGLNHVVISSHSPLDIRCKNSSYPDSVVSVDDNVIDVLRGIAVTSHKDICVIGGVSLIESAVEFADEVLCTRVYVDSLHPEKDFSADCYLDTELINDALEEFNHYVERMYRVGEGTQLNISHYKHLP